MTWWSGLVSIAIATGAALRRLQNRSRDRLPRLSAATRRKRTTRDARFEAVVRGTSDLIFEIDLNGRISGHFGTTNTGWDGDQLRNKSVLDFVHPDDRERGRAALEEFTSSSAAPVIELRGLHSDGRYHWYQIRSASFIDEDGERRILVVNRDIDEQRRATAALRESEQRNRSMVDQSPFGVLVVDSALNVVLANSAYAKLVGAASVDELREHNLFDSPALQSAPMRAMVERVAAGEHVSTEISYTSIFGKRVDARAHVAPIRDEYGNVAAAQLLFEDISTNRLLEDQLRQSQKMEAVGRLAGGIAHDFNNYLTIILGCGEAILGDTRPETIAYEAASQILEVTERSAALTHKLLAFSRHQVARSELVDLADIVAHLEPMLHRVLGDAIELECIRVPGVPSIWADPTLLEQVVVNLAVNARDAMPQGGSLQIRVGSPAGLPPVGYPMQGETVELSVRDTGSGMDEETRMHMFEPFFTTKAEADGTGLGLSTVYGIVRQLNGTIQVSSTPGRGTTFRIGFPKARVEAKQPAAPAPSSLRETGGHERVLVVEDEGPIRRLARNALQRSGYQVVEACDGEHALELARQSTAPIDLLVTDVMMPRMSGPELAAQLRLEYPALRALFISGYADSTLSRRGDALRDIDLLKKPFSPRRLLGRVREVLDRPGLQP